MSEETPLTCRRCKFAVFEDYGFSNWTVEGTTMHCALKVHPKKEVEVTFDDDKDIQFAQECKSFTEGTSIDMDVEHERENDLTAEQRQIYDCYKGNVDRLVIACFMETNRK